MVLPAAFAVVFKRVEDYDMAANSIDLKLTLILRIKLTDVEKYAPPRIVDALKEYLKKKIVLRFNDAKVLPIKDPDADEVEGSSEIKVDTSVRDAKSKDHVSGTPDDIIAYTMRFDSFAKCNFDDQDNFPFDVMTSYF